MFVSSQVRPPSTEKFSNSAVLAVGLSQASRSAGGIIQSMGAVFRGLIGAAVSALSEKHLAGRPKSGFSEASVGYVHHLESGKSPIFAMGSC
jgi:hypothetical protein